MSFASVCGGQWSISFQCFKSAPFDVSFFRSSVSIRGREWEARRCILVTFIYVFCGHFHRNLLVLIVFGTFLVRGCEQTWVVVAMVAVDSH